MLTGVDLAELSVGQALVESSKPCAEEAGRAGSRPVAAT